MRATGSRASFCIYLQHKLLSLLLIWGRAQSHLCEHLGHLQWYQIVTHVLIHAAFSQRIVFFHVSEQCNFNKVSTSLGNLLASLFANRSQHAEVRGLVHLTVKTCGEDYLSTQRWRLPRGYMHGVPKA